MADSGWRMEQEEPMWLIGVGCATMGNLEPLWAVWKTCTALTRRLRSVYWASQGGGVRRNPRENADEEALAADVARVRGSRGVGSRRRARRRRGREEDPGARGGGRAWLPRQALPRGL